MWQRAFNTIDKQCIKHIIPKDTNSNSKQTKLLSPLAAQPTLHHWSAQFSHRSLHHMNMDCLWYRCKAVNTIYKCLVSLWARGNVVKTSLQTLLKRSFFSCRLPLEQCLQRSLYNYIQRHSPDGTGVCWGPTVEVGPAGKRISVIFPGWAWWQCTKVQHTYVCDVYTYKQRYVYTYVPADARIAHSVTERETACVW